MASQDLFSPALTTPLHVLIITKDHHSLDDIQAAYDSHKPLSFYFSPGLFHPRAGERPAYVESLVPAPLLMRVMIDEISPEDENPQGIALNATIQEIARYSTYLTTPRPDALSIATPGKRIRISYNCESHTGGFVVGPYEPFINSRSEIMRIYNDGISFYEVFGTARERPTSNHLQPLPDLAIEAMISGFPVNFHS